MANLVVCCDWGTSSFRLHLLDFSTRQTLAEVKVADGIASAFADWKAAGSDDRLGFYQQRLRSHIDTLVEQTGLDLAGVPVVVSGMASSSIGMMELPYATLPFGIDGGQAIRQWLPARDSFRHDTLLISGVRHESDIMRGEETQLVGLCTSLANRGDLPESATFILPGTHSKHIYVDQGQMVDFQTYMTGEVFATLLNHSILKDSVRRPEGLPANVPDWESFRRGVRQSTRHDLLRNLFTVRVNQVLQRVHKVDNYNFMSGLLIGAELRDLPSTNELYLFSGTNLTDYYRIALDELGLTDKVTRIESERVEQATLEGQLHVFQTAPTTTSF